MNRLTTETETTELRVTEEAELQQEEVETEEEESDAKTISGYAMKFNEPSKDLGGFTEVITPEALEEVDFSDVYLLYNHDYSKPLASTKAGTLKLEVDEVGLKFEAELPDTSYANDVYENISSNIIDSMSFGFQLGVDSFTKEGKEIKRSIDKIDALNEISIVTIPAYANTNVKVDTRSYENFIKENTKTKETAQMKDTVLIDETQTEVRGYEEYIRSKGEERAGVTTENASAVVPSDVIGEVFDLKGSTYNLAQYTTVKEVSNGQGSYPVANVQEATLLTKEELAEIADVDANMFTNVDYKVETRAGKIALSNEVIEDSAVDIVGEVKDQLSQLVINTDNQKIIELLKTLPAVEISGLDDLKKVKNVTLDPALAPMVITNQSGYNHLDTLKDLDERYILQPDVTAPSGFSLFGMPLVVVSNKLLADEGADAPIIIGDLKQAVFVARRNQITTQWEKFDYYSQGLAVIVRNDYKLIDNKAAIYGTLTGAGEVVPAG